MNPIFAKKTFWGGILFIALGLLLLLQNFNLLPFVLPAYVFTWQMLLIVIGVFALPTRSWVGGIALILTGTYFLLPELGIYNFTFSQIWPILLVIVGLMIILNKPGQHKKKMEFKLEKNMDGYIENTVIFGGDSKKVSSYDFKGGQISVVCGGLELDLTNCSLSKQKNILEVDVVMGGISLTVPREWNVISEAVSIMGGVEDEVNELKDRYIDPAAELIIKGSVVMGGLEIKRA